MDYADLRDTLRWQTPGDYLYRAGMDHFKMDRSRFDLAVKTLGQLAGRTICDVGSFPGYGLWAFKDCGRYIGLGKCPEWYREALVNKFHAEWLDCDFENADSLPEPAHKPDIVLLQEVLEHIRRPKSFLSTLHKWMPDRSKLYLTTNNIHYIGYILKLVAGREIFHSATSEGSGYPGHCTYYSLDGLAQFLDDIGFTVLSARRINFLPDSHFYTNRLFAMVKNGLTRSMPRRYSTHLEFLCQKR